MAFNIIWTRPDPNKVTYNFFKDKNKQNFLKDLGYSFTEDSMTELIRTGSFDVLKKEALLNNSENMILIDRDIEDALKSKPFANDLFDNVQDLETRGSLTLPAPVLIKIKGDYFSIGNDHYVLAFRYNEPVRFWVIENLDIITPDEELNAITAMLKKAGLPQYVKEILKIIISIKDSPNNV